MIFFICRDDSNLIFFWNFFRCVDILFLILWVWVGEVIFDDFFYLIMCVYVVEVGFVVGCDNSKRIGIFGVGVVNVYVC